MSDTISQLEELHWKHDLLGSIEIGILVLNRQFEVQIWNEFMENHSGIRPSEIKDRPLFEFFPELDADWFQQKADPVFQLKSPAFIIWEQRPYLFEFSTYRPITSASEHMYQNVTLFPLSSLSGEVEQICVVVYDVTDEAISKQRFAKANEQLKLMSRVDGLTGLFNRRFWEEKCIEEFKRCRRTEYISSLIILDIDNFKKVNDNYGHPAGDQVIKTVADIIQKAIRETDLAGRYGGEEYTVILPDTTSVSARFVAERIRKMAEKSVVVYEGSEISFTVSVGVAEFNPSFTDHVHWLEKADKGLYQAKETGRNKVIVSE